MGPMTSSKVSASQGRTSELAGWRQAALREERVKRRRGGRGGRGGREGGREGDREGGREGGRETLVRGRPHLHATEVV
jgi:hypothetical protein